MSRVLPTPGSPVIVTSWTEGSLRHRRNVARSTEASSARPTNGVFGCSRTSRDTSRGCHAASLPAPSRSSNANRSRVARRVASPTAIPPTGATACSRPASATTSPVTRSPTCGPGPSVTTASPVSIPIRTASGALEPVSSRPSLRSSISCWIRKAARIARSGSSSCAAGAPNTPRTPSPTNLSSVPPKASSTRLIAAWYGRRVAFTSSGSARSERSVKPTRSQNRTVTILRSSLRCNVDPSGVPQRRQNRARSGLRSPQEGHSTVRPVYG